VKLLVDLVVNEGDVVAWKRQGRVGSYRAKVLRIDPAAKLPIVLGLLSHDGRPVPYEKVRCRFGILRVVERAKVTA
jgi:hypothetical protein